MNILGRITKIPGGIMLVLWRLGADYYICSSLIRIGGRLQHASLQQDTMTVLGGCLSLRDGQVKSIC